MISDNHFSPRMTTNGCRRSNICAHPGVGALTGVRSKSAFILHSRSRRMSYLRLGNTPQALYPCE